MPVGGRRLCFGREGSCKRGEVGGRSSYVWTDWLRSRRAFGIGNNKGQQACSCRYAGRTVNAC